MNNNLDTLKMKEPVLANSLRMAGNDPTIELIKAKSGDWTARKHSSDGLWRFINSRVDPRREATIWTECQRIVMPKILVMGVGLAYHIFNLLERYGHIKEVHLIEADEKLFRMAMTLHDFSSLIRNSQLRLYIGTFSHSINARTITSMGPFSFHIFWPAASPYTDLYDPLISLIDGCLCKLRSAEKTGTNRDSMGLGKGIEKLLMHMVSP